VVSVVRASLAARSDSEVRDVGVKLTALSLLGNNKLNLSYLGCSYALFFAPFYLPFPDLY